MMSASDTSRRGMDNLLSIDGGKRRPGLSLPDPFDTSLPEARSDRLGRRDTG